MNKPKKIFILLGHPNSDDTFCKALADEYENSAKVNGASIRRMNLAEMHFDPILHKGYRERQELEPDLLKFQENIIWSNHFVIIYPTWWTNMPALLKGLFDRSWIGGFAVKFRDKALPIRIMKGKTARVISTLGSSAFFERIFLGNVSKTLSDNILKFSGFKVKTLWVGNAEKMSPDTRQNWLEKMSKLAKRDLR